MNEPTCYQCRELPARSGSRFCSTTCAIEWAERFAADAGDDWCPRCNEWLQPEHEHQ